MEVTEGAESFGGEESWVHRRLSMFFFRDFSAFSAAVLRDLRDLRFAFATKTLNAETAENLRRER
jgi:hypothetical protein